MKRLFYHSFSLLIALAQFICAFCAFGMFTSSQVDGVIFFLIGDAVVTLIDAWYRRYWDEAKYWLLVGFILSPARFICEIVTFVRMIIKMVKREDEDFAKRGRFYGSYPVSILVYILLGICYLTPKARAKERAREQAYQERRRREQQEAQARREAEARLNSRPVDTNNAAFLRACFVSGRINAKGEVYIKSCKHSVSGGKGVVDIYYTLKSSYEQYKASGYSTVEAFKDNLMKDANANIKAVLQRNFDAFCARYSRCIRELDITYHTEFIV